MEAEELRTDDLLTSFPDVWTRVVTDPKRFFERLPPPQGVQAPLVFALASLSIGGVGVLLFGGGLKGLLALLVLGLVRLFVGSAIVVLIAQNVFEGRGDYEATFRALGYSSAVAVAIGLPFIRYFAALYGLYLTILGVARAHSFDNVRATLSLAGAGVCAIMLAHAFGLGGVVARFNPLGTWR